MSNPRTQKSHNGMFEPRKGPHGPAVTRSVRPEGITRGMLLLGMWLKESIKQEAPAGYPHNPLSTADWAYIKAVHERLLRLRALKEEDPVKFTALVDRLEDSLETVATAEYERVAAAASLDASDGDDWAMFADDYYNVAVIIDDMTNVERDHADSAEFRPRRPRSEDTDAKILKPAITRLVSGRINFLGLAHAILSEDGAVCDVCAEPNPVVVAYPHGAGADRMCANCDREAHLFRRAEFRAMLVGAHRGRGVPVLHELRPDEFAVSAEPGIERPSAGPSDEAMRRRLPPGIDVCGMYSRCDTPRGYGL